MDEKSDLLLEIEEDLGIEAALLLTREYGGQAISIPTTVEGCRIERDLGAELAKWLVERYGGTSMDFPVGFKYRKNRVRHGVAESPNLSANQLARKFGVTRSRIWQLRRELGLNNSSKPGPACRVPKKEDVGAAHTARAYGDEADD